MSAAGAAGESAAGTSPVIEIFPVAIGHYDSAGLPDLEVEDHVGRVLDLLAPFGGRHVPWEVPELERNADAVERRLGQWADSGSRPVDGSVLYWVGHGWTDGTRAALAHQQSPGRVGSAGVSPEDIADAVRRRQAQPGRRSWAVVVVDACRSQRFAKLLGSLLLADDRVRDVLLVGVSGEGATTLGRFSEALGIVVKTTYAANRRITLKDLGSQLEDLLEDCTVTPLKVGRAALVHVFPPAASWMCAPYDTVRHLEDVLENLGPDERHHFFTKAQGVEYGELSWFFEGRASELRRISAWLRTATTGMLVVHGRAGAGKSALLGNVMVQSLPDLRDALARRGLATPLAPGDLPPDGVFDAVIHLSGLTVPQIVARTAAAARLEPPPSHSNSALGMATDLDWLADQLSRLCNPEPPGETASFTVLVDALDESTDPLDTARSLLARIAAIRGVRVVVGTRVSTRELFDAPPPDTDLLDALATLPPPTRHGPGAVPYRPASRDTHVDVTGDTAAIRSYVRRRLDGARRFGRAGRSVPFMDRVRDEDIERVAENIAGRNREFLYTRLAVYELVEDARLLTEGRTRSLGELLAGDHQDLFGRALKRLGEEDDRYPLLLRALAHAQGRGVPEADGIWAAMVAALDTSPSADCGDDIRSVWAEAIGGLLTRAAAYVIVDTPTADTPSARTAEPAAADGTSTVYRLAHRSFTEFFAVRDRERPEHRCDRIRIADALLRAAARSAAADTDPVPEYLVRHLSGHVASAEMWDALADRPDILDRLDPDAVTADALRTLFGRRPIPPRVAGVIGARDALVTASPRDRAGLRQMATATHGAQRVIDEPTRNWGIAAARARPVTPHVRLGGHTASVNSVRSLQLPRRGTIIASAGDDGSIRLWDPATATPIGSPMLGHTSTVEDLAVFRDPGGRIMLASAGGEGAVRLWDVYTGWEVGEPLTGHVGRIFGMCTIPGSGTGRPDRIATAGADGTVRIWDPVAGRQVGEPLIGHQGWAWAVCAIPRTAADVAYGGARLASCGDDGTVRIWDVATGEQVGEPLTGHRSTVFCVCAFPDPDSAGRWLLAGVGGDGKLVLWDPESGRTEGRVIAEYPDSLITVCAVPGYGGTGRSVLAATGYDGAVALWDSTTGEPVGHPLTGDAGAAWGMCVLPSPDPGGPVLLATTGSDGTLRVWDPAAGQPADRSGPRLKQSARRVAVLPGDRDGVPMLVTSGFGGDLWVWDPVTCRPVDHPLTHHSKRVWTLFTVPGGGPDGRSVLAGVGQDRMADRVVTEGGQDRRVHLWDPQTGEQVGVPLGRADQAGWTACAVPWSPTGGADAGALVAVAGTGSEVELWDPRSGRPVLRLDTDHRNAVTGICALPGFHPDGRPNGRSFLATYDDDLVVRVWDPLSGSPVGPPLVGHTSDIQDICSFPWDGQPMGRSLLATVSFDGTLRMWDPVLGRGYGPEMSGHRSGVLSVCPLPGNRPDAPTLLVTTGYDRTVRIWSPETGEQVTGTLAGHTGRVWGACPLPGFLLGVPPGPYPLVATTGDDGTVRLWNPNSGRAVGEPLTQSSDTVCSLAQAVGSDPGCPVLTADGRVHLWETTTASLSPVSAPPLITAVASYATGGGTALVAGDASGFVHLLTPDGGRFVRPPVQGEEGAVLALCVLDVDGSATVAAGGRSGAIALWRPLDGDGSGEEAPRFLRGHSAPVRDLCALDDGNRRLLVSAGDDGSVRIWDPTAGGARSAPLTGHDGTVWALAVLPAPGGPMVASAGADCTVRLWDPVTARQIIELSGHTDQVRAIACITAADGRTLLASGSFDGTVRLWDHTSGAAVHTIPLGVPVHALRRQPADRRRLERTDHGATLTVGLRTGILALDVNSCLFPARPGL
ncbi:WD40 repeat domain-containing protein [Streptomyces sp. NPDC021020]|uniref:WD40 repeat domain-containing protein n=1 Tax=Streptomyces sp. NPDC021020 TaxID=3365109 RepID=UPI003787F6AF